MWFSTKIYSQYKFCHLISILRPWWILFGSGSEVHRNYGSQTISPIQGKYNKEDNLQKITKMKIIFHLNLFMTKLLNGNTRYSRCVVTFFESFFLKGLCDFLGIFYVIPHFNIYVNTFKTFIWVIIRNKLRAFSFQEKRIFF